MKRRDFLKSAIGAAAAAAAMPSALKADIIPDDGTKPLPLESVSVDRQRFRENNAQTIIIYLAGGMSDAVANLTHIPQIVEEDLSQTPYPEGLLTPTAHGFWQEAGGEILERLIASGDLTLFRTCYSRGASVAHGINQMHYCHGNDKGYESGIVTTLMHVLNREGLVGENDLFANVSVDGFYKLLQDFAAPEPLPAYLRPVWFGRDFDNPYNYKRDDRGQVDLGDYKTNEIFNAADYDERLNALMQRHNHYDALADVFNKRKEISDFIEETKSRELPVEYPGTVDGKRLEAAMRILTNNPDTRIVSMQGGHSGWDDHSDAIPLHRARARELFEAIEAAVAHMNAENIDNINIVVYGDFGRNLNINKSAGWDHGNNQVVYWFGGKRYLNHPGTREAPEKGIIGETELHIWLPKMRLYNRPTADSFQFPGYSIAATLYAIYGITNPEVLTGGYGIIDPSSHVDYNTPFLKT